jgi:hypothetical protein
MWISPHILLYVSCASKGMPPILSRDMNDGELKDQVPGSASAPLDEMSKSAFESN